MSRNSYLKSCSAVAGNNFRQRQSSDITGMQKLAQCADMVVVWGSDTAIQAVRKLVPPESRAVLTEILIQAGINRIFPAGKMSDTILGEAHDGEYPLRRYTRTVNIIK